MLSLLHHLLHLFIKAGAVNDETRTAGCRIRTKHNGSAIIRDRKGSNTDYARLCCKKKRGLLPLFSLNRPLTTNHNNSSGQVKDLLFNMSLLLFLGSNSNLNCDPSSDKHIYLLLGHLNLRTAQRQKAERPTTTLGLVC